MEDWMDESPSDEDDRNEIENELYSMVYYHSMSDGIPKDLAEKYDLEVDDFGVTISLKDSTITDTSESNSAKNPSNETINEGTSSFCRRTNDRYIDGHNSDSNSLGHHSATEINSNQSEFVKLPTSTPHHVDLPHTSHSNVPNDCAANPQNFISSFQNTKCGGTKKTPLIYDVGINNYKSDVALTTIDVVDLTGCKKISRNKRKKLNKKNNKKIKSGNVVTICISSESEDSDVSCESSSSSMADTTVRDSLILNTSNDWQSSSSELEVTISTSYDWKLTTSPSSWTKSMRRFYNKPAEERINLDPTVYITNLRNRGVSTWRISDADLWGPRKGWRRRCDRCQEDGHHAAKCTKVFSCHMCGTSGHLANHCPKKICFGCGTERLDEFVSSCTSCYSWGKNTCSVCNIQGHSAEQCTNAWRNFVSEKGEGHSNKKRNGLLYCCNCAKRGHTFDDCQNKIAFYPKNYNAVRTPVLPAKRNIVGKKKNKRKRVATESLSELLPGHQPGNLSNKKKKKFFTRNRKMPFHSFF